MKSSGQRFLDRVLDLISVKSIVTLALCGAFVYLSVIGQITPDVFMPVFTTVISFYFGIQHEKRKGTVDNG